MIQRIQTIYLFIASVLMAITNFLPLLKFSVSEQETILFKTFGIGCGAITTYPIAIIAILSAILLFISIFMYKNRIKQIKIASISLFLSIMFYAVFAIYLWYTKDLIEYTYTSVSFGLILPAISVILNILAVKAIKADERLVRSADRIR
ncbi:MAG: DUF4293 domain-containing protein [Bacteroidaceae bacterium]|nr:DUF4293 domain-containing protein [Bacteroidaceae bacterium]